ncbi:MAG TPA: rod shape-determining protein MreC [Polyangiales bacterium]|nr:rod shape-determining protein MreC [Polyangiales bacterium]
MNFYRRFRDAAVCVALLALPFFFLRANLQDPTRATVVDRALLQLSAPFQYVATQLALGVSGILQDYVYLVEVKQDNDRLRDENARLREANFKLQAAATENRALRRLLQLREQLRGALLSAQVIGKGNSPYFRVARLQLDRGDRDHVRAGMPVLTADGLVGQVRRTSGRFSDVLLVADDTSAIDVVIQRSGARGILKGTGSVEHYACRLEHLSREDDVQVGDLVVTSGLGQRFPASILVGHVDSVDKRDFGLFQEATVTPAVRFSRLEEVMIMTSGSRSQGLQDAPAGTQE